MSVSTFWYFSLFVGILISLCDHVRGHQLFSIRGGLVPMGGENQEGYFDKFSLDYDCDDSVRSAGFVRGWLPIKQLRAMKDKDFFLNWWNKYLVDGKKSPVGRVKLYHAMDIGTKADLKKGEHPKIIILNNPISTDGSMKNLENLKPTEVRNIWQPWLRSRCQFAIRYIVPDRISIMRLLEEKGRLQVKVTKSNTADKRNNILSTLTIKPTIWQRLWGYRSVQLTRKLDLKS